MFSIKLLFCFNSSPRCVTNCLNDRLWISCHNRSFYGSFPQAFYTFWTASRDNLTNIGRQDIVHISVAQPNKKSNCNKWSLLPNRKTHFILHFSCKSAKINGSTILLWMSSRGTPYVFGGINIIFKCKPNVNRCHEFFQDNFQNNKVSHNKQSLHPDAIRPFGDEITEWKMG